MKTFARKIYMFNNFLRLAEIKAVLEGRGFRPNFLVTGRGALKLGGDRTRIGHWAYLTALENRYMINKVLQLF
jgi:hypothetical protein